MRFYEIFIFSVQIADIPKTFHQNNLIGDINDDNTIDILDVVSLVNLILGITDQNVDADINLDNMAFAVLLLIVN